MKLIVGLGNPGKKYEQTRHNAGFMFVDKFVSDQNGTFTLNKKLRSEIFQTNINGENVIVAKPITYMNLSGEAIRLIVDYYKIDLDDIVIVYDDLDLPVGSLRARTSGSSGGHKGMQSTINHLKTDNIKRIRLGISSPHNKEVIDYVLGKFSVDELTSINKIIDNSSNIIKDYISKDFIEFMNLYN